MKTDKLQVIQPTLSVGEVSKRSGVAVSALHFYEEKGLVFSQRTVGNQRRYARDTLRRLAFIRVAQRVGISLADVRTTLAELPKKRTPTRADWARVASIWKRELDERIERLARLRDSLDDCIGCGCLSTEQCALYNPGDVAARSGPGALVLRQLE